MTRKFGLPLLCVLLLAGAAFAGHADPRISQIARPPGRTGVPAASKEG